MNTQIIYFQFEVFRLPFMTLKSTDLRILAKIMGGHFSCSSRASRLKVNCKEWLLAFATEHMGCFLSCSSHLTSSIGNWNDVAVSSELLTLYQLHQRATTALTEENWYYYMSESSIVMNCSIPHLCSLVLIVFIRVHSRSDWCVTLAWILL